MKLLIHGPVMLVKRDRVDCYGLVEQILRQNRWLRRPYLAHRGRMMCLVPIIAAMALVATGTPAKAGLIVRGAAIFASDITIHGPYKAKFFERELEPMSRTHIDVIAPHHSADDEARGRKTLSIAFVMVGPDGYLSIKHQNGSVLVLRDVTMGPKKYCGVQTFEGGHTRQYCGRYDEIAFARAGTTAIMD